MYIKAQELENYEKEVYFSVRVLELLDDGQWYKKNDLAEMLKLDRKSVV